MLLFVFFPNFAAMKMIRVPILFLLLLALTACVKVPEPFEGPTRKGNPDSTLIAIDNLIWQRPDSALAYLLPYFDTCCAAEHDRHYAHLLLSELLYKNDYAQTNRAELQIAVVYFDSLMQVPELVEGPSKKQNAFLSARAHYINGVGYYEQDSIVQACREYLKALETMENYYKGKDLAGEKAKFTTYTYNRLGELFSAQFMMEPAILCCERSLYYCKIAPTSPFGVSNTLLQLGKQYDKLGEIEKASDYYEQAKEALPIQQGLLYRDIIAQKAFCDYRLRIKRDESLNSLKHILTQATSESEEMVRFMAIGDIFFEEGLYDSALVYLEPIFELDENQIHKVAAANYLRIIYDRLCCEEKSDECRRYLANQKKSEGQNKALVSQLEGMFQTYQNLKQEKQAETARRKAIEKTVSIVIPIAMALALVIIVLAKLRSWRLLNQQQAMADKTLEEHKKKHEKERESLLKGIKQREEQMEALKKALVQQKDDIESRRVDFLKEPICAKINDNIRKINITAREGSKQNVKLNDEDATALKDAVLNHYPDFESVLLSKNPTMSKDDLQLCQLYLLGLDERQIAVLQCKTYSAIKKRAKTLKNLMGIDKNLSDYILNH